MSNAVRNGFSALNRFLGKKNKDSSTNTSFEQTFRITIYLPCDQLYVAQVGTKTKLWQILEMVCTNKTLDKTKFEFRHPSDSSQVYSNDLTIGEIGLNKIRLTLKTDSHHETYPKFHNDEILKLTSK